MFNIVLYSPQIPPNTGVAARLCAATGARLHLIRPLGFRLDDAAMRRAGLDYWSTVDVTVHANLDEFFTQAGFEPLASAPNELDILKTPLSPDALAACTPAARSLSNPAPVRPPIYFVTKHGRHRYTDVSYPAGAWLLFGSETRGLPPELLAAHPDRTLLIPMREGTVRSLNLATSVAVVLFEGLRQNGFTFDQ